MQVRPLGVLPAAGGQNCPNGPYGLARNANAAIMRPKNQLDDTGHITIVINLTNGCQREGRDDCKTVLA